MKKRKTNRDHEKKLKKTWANYWQNYQGVTKTGAWSQRQALKKAFSVITKANVESDIRIIDVGSGEGRTLQAFREKGFNKSIGIDNVQESLEICQSNGLKIKKDVFLADAKKTGFKNKEFDLVFSEGLLEHFLNPEPLIKEMVRISKRYILLIQPNYDSLFGLVIAFWGYLLRNNVKEYSYPKKYFVKRFNNHNFLLRAEKYTPLREFFILLFEKIRID